MLVRVGTSVYNLAQATEIHRREDDGSITIFWSSEAEEAGRASTSLEGEEAEDLWKWLAHNADAAV